MESRTTARRASIKRAKGNIDLTFLVLVLTLLADYRLLVKASEHGLVLPALIAVILLTLVVAGVVMVQLPVDVMFLTGGGITLDQWLFRVILRKCRRVIYTKYSSEQEEND